jgi:ZIP family zinc transporter
MNLQDIEIFISQYSPIQQALAATTFTWFLTALGASFVFFFKTMKRQFFDGMLGFTGGVMIAASYWSLLAPAIEISPISNPGVPNWFPAAVGFLAGALFLYALDKVMPHLHINFESEEKEGIKTNWNRTILLVLAITLHNIPEGLAVGVAFGAVAHGVEGANLGAAIALAIGIGLQNFPEGIAVAMPLRRSGVSRIKSFWYGQLSAVVEPVAGVLGSIGGGVCHAYSPLCTCFCSRGHDLCSYRRSSTRNPARPLHRLFYHRLYYWLYCNDGA